MPRLARACVTDVCLKRKIRNFIQTAHTDKRIYFTEGAVHNKQHKEAYEAENLGDPKKAKAAEHDTARTWMCKNFYDVRAFGAVMSTEINCGQVRGPVQLSFARSVDPIVTSEHAITRTSVTNEKDIEKGRTSGPQVYHPLRTLSRSRLCEPFPRRANWLLR